jgi:hypothetical protein
MDVDAWPGLLRTKALLWQVLGEQEKALTTLGQLTDTKAPFGAPGLIWMIAFDSLRDTSGFQQILAKQGLEGRRPIRAEP